jgi:hypothetical protein
MRAEFDRAVATWGESSGSTDAVYANAQLLADEVVGLGFEYFDGAEWLTDWDSSSSGGLPRAIRVWLSILPTYGMSEEELAQAAAGQEPASTDFYFCINVPSAPLVAPPAETTETAEATSAASGSTQSSGGTTQGATQ